MSKWEISTFEAFVNKGELSIQTGPFGTQLKASDYAESGSPVINVRNIGSGIIIDDNIEYIADETRDRLSSHILRKDDIVFGRKGAVERHAFVDQKHDGWLQGSDCIRVRIESPTLRPRYASYCLLTPAHKTWMANNCSHGATMASLNQDIVKRIEIPVPETQVQDQVISMLSAYDDLIENNNRRIAILEEMAQKLYCEWFVHFRFPGHENVKMVESEMGLIPEGWCISKLGTIVDNFDSKRKPISTLKRKSMQGEYPYYGAAKIIDHVNDYIFNDTFLLMAEDGSVITSENTPMLQYVSGKIWVNNHTHILRGTVVSTEYLFLALSRLDVRGYITGAAQPKITQENLNRIPVLVPSDDIAESFDTYVQKTFDERIILENKNINLRKTRDLLLPRLISGDINVSDLDIPIKEG